MKIDTMRKLDRWAGVPICFALTLWRRVADGLARVGLGRRRAVPRPGEAAPEPPRVLLVKLAEMGSTVLASRAIERLNALYPGARLHYLCFEENSPVLELLDEVRWEGLHTLRTGSLRAFAVDVLRVRRRLRQLRIDIAIDLEIFSRGSATLVYLSGAPVRVGFHKFHAESPYCGDLFTHRLTYNSHLHTSGAFMALIEALDADPGELPLLKKRIEPPRTLPQFRPTAAERDGVLATLRERGYPADGSARIVILNTNASDLLPLRRWPSERFEELAQRCLDAWDDVFVVFTGAPTEAGAVEKLVRRVNRERVINMAGQTTLRELVTLFGLSTVLVTNDSGPSHFAALTPIWIVSLFGPETPVLYHSVSERAISLNAGLACSPCINVFNGRLSACTNNRCVQAIHVDQVFAEIEPILSGAGGAASVSILPRPRQETGADA
jgi:ADP-heptose:LPS heptosyltransferase